jgi:hypothetical protein
MIPENTWSPFIKKFDILVINAGQRLNQRMIQEDICCRFTKKYDLGA